MSDALKVYLHDHLAGSHFAVQLLGTLHEQHRDEPLGAFALALRDEVTADQDALRRIVDQVGRGAVDLTEATGWLAEKASQFKLSRDDSGKGIGTFEALETVALGIQGKLSLWRVMAVVQEFDSRIPDEDFERLAARAKDQHSLIEQQRMQLARLTFQRKS